MKNLFWNARDLSGTDIKVTANGHECLRTYFIEIHDVKIENLTMYGKGDIRGYKLHNGRPYNDPNSTYDNPVAAQYCYRDAEVRIEFANDGDMQKVIKLFVGDED